MSHNQPTGFDLAAVCLRAAELRALARGLDRRGGGFTAHASAMLKTKATRLDSIADSIAADLDSSRPGGEA